MKIKLKDKLNEVKQTNFTKEKLSNISFDKYKNKIINKLFELRKQGIKDYYTKIPCNIYERIEKYFNNEGIWVLYLGSDNNKVCRMLICSEVTEEELNAMKENNIRRYGKI